MSAPMDANLALQASQTSDVIQRKQEMDALRGRFGDQRTKEEKLRQACEGFESIFIQKMWEQMRATVPQDGYLHSKEEKIWQSMFDQELSIKMSSAGGIGLADMLYDQLGVKLLDASRVASPSQAAFSNRVAPVKPLSGPVPSIPLLKNDVGLSVDLYSPVDLNSNDTQGQNLQQTAQSIGASNNTNDALFSDAAAVASITGEKVVGAVGSQNAMGVVPSTAPVYTQVGEVQNAATLSSPHARSVDDYTKNAFARQESENLDAVARSLQEMARSVQTEEERARAINGGIIPSVGTTIRPVAENSDQLYQSSTMTNPNQNTRLQQRTSTIGNDIPVINGNAARTFGTIAQDTARPELQVVAAATMPKGEKDK